MLKFTVFIFASIAVCQIISTEGTPVLCGPTPNEVYSCLGAPKIVSPDVASQCNSSLPECERMTCIFRKSGWMDGEKVDKVKLSAHFDQLAKNNPEWAAGVENAKITCLTTDLPAQGIHLNCPAYDSTVCTFASFIKNTQPSQWKSNPKCSRARQFAASCPICPNDCFAPLVPVGSCNACLSLPRSP
ncbi:uncharacterized protein LOC123658153 isoform X2 [Melitaea cinxia]|uniref:uncharacterized protein LOC123658153 isoform X1 n=1 Tax=Melitaea cinxia TaxID=113334 RepID=UPI001E273924|nr:uncharacterized protein LOC123658153 isoform X1 [Melitaea cinxia]XP_045449550.1 uncharacterized protein LOC123658153 isoform X2 [Melitaea cinxia]